MSLAASSSASVRASVGSSTGASLSVTRTRSEVGVGGVVVGGLEREHRELQAQRLAVVAAAGVGQVDALSIPRH